jgi:CRISPR/Cas system CMR-associated protein Cmr3 (group 5 of RAMP superfamily)
MGVKNERAVARDRRKWRKIVLQAKIHNWLALEKKKKKKNNILYQFIFFHFPDGISLFRF